MDSNQDTSDSTPELQASSVGPGSEPSVPGSTDFRTSDFGNGEPPNDGGWGVPQAGPPNGPRWGRRLAAAGAALAILVGVGFAGHLIGNPTSSQQATQPIPSPAASS